MRKLTKKQRILKIIKENGGSISIIEILQKMYYPTTAQAIIGSVKGNIGIKQAQLENWIFKLNIERKITINTNPKKMKDWIVSLYDPKKG